MLCNRTIYCGSGSDFGKVSFLVPDLNPEPFQTSEKKCTKNLAFLMLEAALFPRKMSSHLRFFEFFTFALHFMLDPDPYPDPESNFITVLVLPRQKVVFSSFPVAQH